MKAKPTRHVYDGDGLKDVWGFDRCQQPRCGLPEGHEVHVMPAGGDDVRRAAAGDKDENGQENR